MPMDPKKLIYQFSWKRSQSAVFSHLHKIHFADIWLVSAYTVTYIHTGTPSTPSNSENYQQSYTCLHPQVFNFTERLLASQEYGNLIGAFRTAGRVTRPYFSACACASRKIGLVPRLHSSAVSAVQ